MIPFGLVLAAAQVAPDWRPVGFVGEGDSDAVAYVDVAHFAQPDETMREAAILTVFATPRKAVDGTPFDAVRATYRIDCTTRLGHTTGAVALAGARDLGELNADPVELPFDGDRAFARVAEMVCDGDQSGVRNRPMGDPLSDAKARFAYQDFARASLTAASWYRLDATSVGGKRLALFIDKDSIVRRSDGRYLAATMLVDEGVSDAQRFNYATLIDCTVRVRSNPYSIYYRLDGNYVGRAIPRVADRPIQGRFIGMLYAPICAGDWSKTHAFPGMPLEIAGSPSALEP